MARIRSVKPGFWKDGDLATLPRDARLFYIALWNFADEEARVKGDPRYLKAECFPLDEDVTPDLINIWLDHLESIGDVRRYKVKAKSYLYLPNLPDHQTLRPQNTPSSLPAPPDTIVEQGDRKIPDDSGKVVNVHASRARLKQETSPDPETRGGVGGIADDSLAFAICEACDLGPGHLTTSERRDVEACRRSLSEVRATPEEVKRRGENWYVSHDYHLTPRVLERNWSSLDKVRANGARAGPGKNTQVITRAVAKLEASQNGSHP